MTGFRIVASTLVDQEVEEAFQWYETEQPGLGFEFLEELGAAYKRIEVGPLKYQVLRSDIRRALLRRFPYAVFFAVEGELVVILAVLHAGRDPGRWRRRRK